VNRKEFLVDRFSVKHGEKGLEFEHAFINGTEAVPHLQAVADNKAVLKIVIEPVTPTSFIGRPLGHIESGYARKPGEPICKVCNGQVECRCGRQAEQDAEAAARGKSDKQPEPPAPPKKQKSTPTPGDGQPQLP